MSLSWGAEGHLLRQMASLLGQVLHKAAAVHFACWLMAKHFPGALQVIDFIEK
jgi:hypothetical protein